MKFRAVANRCAVHLDSLFLPFQNDDVVNLLLANGFKVLDVDLIACARQCVGRTSYKLCAQVSEAPHVVDCSSFIKWAYGQSGIWVPRRAVQQRSCGLQLGLHEIERNDVVFVSGFIDYYYDNPKDGVGHVGIATGENTIIHAANGGVKEVSLEEFISKGFRGVCRYVPKNCDVITLEVPIHREVETSDDIRWIVLQLLSK